MKKLSVLLVKSFVGPFFATFLVSLFLFLLQFLWKHLPEIVGKGLEWYVIAEFILYSAIFLIPRALPLAVLLSSVMTFGNLGERYELVALKSSGISLLRIMRPMLGVMIILGLITFYTTNKLIPIANLNWGALYYDVTHKKPAFSIEDGIFFNELNGYSIRVGKKHKDNQTLEDVLIYQTDSRNRSVGIIIAKKGKMHFSEDKRFMFLELFEGKRYEEMVNASNYQKNLPHNIVEFKEQRMVMDMTELQFQRTEKESFKDDYRMLDITGLKNKMDSMQLRYQDKIDYLEKYTISHLHLPKNDSSAESKVNFKFNDFQQKTPLIDQIGNYIILKDQNDTTLEINDKENRTIDTFTALVNKDKIDTNRKNNLFKPLGLKKIKNKAINKKPIVIKKPLNQKSVVDKALQKSRTIHQIVENNTDQMRNMYKSRYKYGREFYSKFSVAFSCILLFFIAAPMGAIIRRGGFGMPLVVAILLYIVYFIIETIGHKLAREGVLEIWFGVWLPTFILAPIAVFMTYKANRDAKLFDIDWYLKYWRLIKGLFIR